MNEGENTIIQDRLERLFADGLPAMEVESKDYRGYLNDEQILDGMQAIAQNAEELLADAQLLFEGGRYARAASLSVLALEETFKSLLLCVYPLVRHDVEGRKQFWKAWRNHRVKSSTPATAPFLWGQIDEARRSELTEALGRWADLLKQRGLYADCKEQLVEEAGTPRWALPSQLVSEAEAHEAIELAATFVVPFPTEDARWVIQLAGSSENALEVLLALATQTEQFASGQDSDVITSVPDNIRRFVQSMVESPNDPGNDEPG